MTCLPVSLCVRDLEAKGVDAHADGEPARILVDL